jgi:RNA recognition motif-containing protein
MDRTLFVDCIPSFLTDQQLKELFQRYGTVLSAEVMRYPNGESLEFGYVEMATSDEANIAARRLNGTHLYGQALRVKIDQQEKKNEPRWGGDEGW